ncbi:hypothetical protein C4D60_Mb04t21620 [Musa balbisiana]|uniref:Uncharacterized protein n=1 Tax=Musa balbisiana TaxID=52838 RepID=A0A4S8KDQ0_MUSBA|nr:hypothetical protein C4D60_Mb04t21620 [Musa balbisiana]
MEVCDSDPHPTTRPRGFSEGDEQRDEAEPWRAAGEIGREEQLMERLDGGAVEPGGACPPFHRRQEYMKKFEEAKGC